MSLARGTNPAAHWGVYYRLVITVQESTKLSGDRSANSQTGETGLAPFFCHCRRVESTREEPLWVPSLPFAACQLSHSPCPQPDGRFPGSAWVLSLAWGRRLPAQGSNIGAGPALRQTRPSDIFPHLDTSTEHAHVLPRSKLFYPSVALTDPSPAESNLAAFQHVELGLELEPDPVRDTIRRPQGPNGGRNRSNTGRKSSRRPAAFRHASHSPRLPSSDGL